MPQSAAVVLAGNRRVAPPVVAIDADPAVAVARAALTRRVPVPNGDCSVMLPGQGDVLSDTATSVVATRLPGGGPGLLAVGVIIGSKDFATTSPRFAAARRGFFQSNWSTHVEMCRGPFHAADLVSYEPVTLRGLYGFEARLSTGSVDKRQVELFSGPRCFKFEVVRSEGTLGADDVALFHAVIASFEDVADLKKDLTP